MPLTIRIHATVGDRARNDFASMGEVIFGAYQRVGESAGIPSCDVDLVLTDDFVADVRRLRPVGAERDFVPERIGGQVAGKCIPLDEEWTRATVLLDAAHWNSGGDSPTPYHRVLEMFLLAHELAHPLFERARVASGVLAGDQGVGPSSLENRPLIRAIVDEYRVDRLADQVVGSLVTVTVEGEERPAGYSALIGGIYVEELREVLRGVHPQWVDEVQSCCAGRTHYLDLWASLAPKISGVLLLLAHAQAQSDGGDPEGPTSVLEREGLSDLPATLRIFGSPWLELIKVIQSQRLLPDQSDFAASEVELLRAGGSCVRGVLGALGLSMTDQADGTYWLGVIDPPAARLS